jgi:hypothetical protein
MCATAPWCVGVHFSGRHRSALLEAEQGVTRRGEKGSTVGDERHRAASQSGEHLRLLGEATDLVADTVRSDLVMDTVRDDPEERTEAVPTVQGYLEPPSRPVSAPPAAVRALLLASEEVTREVRPRTLPPPRAAVREVFARDSGSDRVRQATGRQPAYVPGAVAHRDAPRPRASYAPRPRYATPERASAPPTPAPSRPPPLREDNPITFVAEPAAASRHNPKRVHLPWWVAMGVGLTLGLAVATAGFAAWVSTREPAVERAPSPPSPTDGERPPAQAAQAAQAAPPAAAPPVSAPLRVGAASLAWALSERRTWQGATVGDDNRWSAVLSLRLGDDGVVRGYLAWSAVSVQGAREGEQVREDVDGSWDEARGALTLRGTASTNPLLMPVNSYRLHASPTGALQGAAIDDGVRIALTPVAQRRPRRHHDD